MTRVRVGVCMIALIVFTLLVQYLGEAAFFRGKPLNKGNLALQGTSTTPFCGTRFDSATNICIGVEHGQAYCYGSNSGCLHGTKQCITDAECAHFNARSQKHPGGLCDDTSETKSKNEWKNYSCRGILTTQQSVSKSGEENACPVGSTTSPDRCYTMQPQPITWQACQRHCASTNTNLLSIRSHAADQYVISDLVSRYNQTYWVVDEQQTTQHTSSDLSAVDHTSNDPNEHDPTQGVCSTANVATGELTYADCNTPEISCVCETPVKRDVPACAPGWVVGLSGDCYLLESDPSTHPTCANTCAAQEASMLCVTDAEHDGFIRNITQGRSTWLGLMHTVSGEWAWPLGCASAYTKWAAVETAADNILKKLLASSPVGNYAAMIADLHNDWAPQLPDTKEVFCACQSGNSCVHFGVLNTTCSVCSLSVLIDSFHHFCVCVFLLSASRGYDIGS